MGCYRLGFPAGASSFETACTHTFIPDNSVDAYTVAVSICDGNMLLNFGAEFSRPLNSLDSGI